MSGMAATMLIPTTSRHIEGFGEHPTGSEYGQWLIINQFREIISEIIQKTQFSRPIIHSAVSPTPTTKPNTCKVLLKQILAE
jgi:hypothetical protein